MLPPLIDILPEARLNLVVYYLRQGEYAPYAAIALQQQKLVIDLSDTLLIIKLSIFVCVFKNLQLTPTCLLKFHDKQNISQSTRFACRWKTSSTFFK